MDDTTTVEELKELVRELVQDRDWEPFHNPKDLAIGVITEASELLEHFRFKSEQEMQEILSGPKRTEIENELADVLIFVLEFARMNDIDLSQACQSKVAEVAQKYPIEKARGHKKKYTELN